MNTFSSGDLLRAKAKEDSPQGKQIAEMQAKGELCTSSMVVDLLL